MKFAVNYSPTLGRLAREGRVVLDRFKCPAWPALIREAAATLPVYIHFPLIVGRGLGAPLNSETGQAADLGALEALMDETGTPYMNTHFYPTPASLGGADPDDLSPRARRRVIDAALLDLEPLVNRLGPEKVLVENLMAEPNLMRAAVLPETISELAERAGCGLLFDLSHARITTETMGLDLVEYVRALPVEKMREAHVTGIQVLEGRWVEMMREWNDMLFSFESWLGKRIDHLPMVADDWAALGWLLGEIRAGRMAEPWVLAYECGGVGPFWEKVGEEAMYLEQIPRMREMVIS